MITLNKKKAILGLIILILLTLAPGIYFYQQYQRSQYLLNNPTEATKDEARKLREKVGRYIDLPEEEPNIATITDKSKVADQPFFAKAEVGDKVLIFQNARRAVLYRPSQDRIIEMAPLGSGG